MSQGRAKKVIKADAAGSTMESIVAQWRKERPDLDPRPMAVVGTLFRAAEVLRRGVLKNWANYDLDFPGGDMLLTLRRQGHGQTLSPSALAQEMMLSTSAMTNRIDRLEKRGLLQRIQDPDDRRSLKICLTQQGFDLADDIIGSHVDTEEDLLSPLSQKEQNQLQALLSKLDH